MGKIVDWWIKSQMDRVKYALDEYRKREKSQIEFVLHELEKGGFVEPAYRVVPQRLEEIQAEQQAE